MPSHPDRVRSNYETPSMINVPAIKCDVKALLDYAEWYVMAQVAHQFNTRRAQEAVERLREWVGE